MTRNEMQCPLELGYQLNWNKLKVRAKQSGGGLFGLRTKDNDRIYTKKA